MVITGLNGDRNNNPVSSVVDIIRLFVLNKATGVKFKVRFGLYFEKFFVSHKEYEVEPSF